MKITLDEMQAFVSVVDGGSISAAANQLSQTVSGISRALNRLENKLDTTLLRRTTRRLELTEEGEHFLEQARRIIAEVETAEAHMATRRQHPAGRLRIDSASPFMLHVIVPLIGKFRRQYPDIELELYTNDYIVDLIEHRTDVAIRIGVLRDSSLHARPLGKSRLRILASPPYLAEHGTPRSAAELTQHQLLGFAQPEHLNYWPLNDQNGNPRLITPTLRASSGETLRQLALHHAGLVCLTDFVTHHDREQGHLVEVLAEETIDLFRPVNAVYYRNTALAARIACFLDFLAEELAGLRCVS